MNSDLKVLIRYNGTIRPHKIKKQTKLEKVFKSFCEKVKEPRQNVHFYYNGNEISGSDTVQSRNIADDGEISVVLRKQSQSKCSDALKSEVPNGTNKSNKNKENSVNDRSKMKRTRGDDENTVDTANSMSESAVKIQKYTNQVRNLLPVQDRLFNLKANKPTCKQMPSEMLAKWTEEKKQIQDDHAKKLESLENDFNKEMQKHSKRYQKELDSLKVKLKEMRSENEDLQHEFDLTEVEINQKHAEELETQKDRIAKDLKKQFELKQSEIEQKHADELTSERVRIAEELQKQFNLKLSELRQKHANELASERARIKELQNQFENTKIELKQTHQNEIATEKARIDEVKKQFDLKISALQRQHATELASEKIRPLEYLEKQFKVETKLKNDSKLNPETKFKAVIDELTSQTVARNIEELRKQFELKTMEAKKQHVNELKAAEVRIEQYFRSKFNDQLKHSMPIPPANSDDSNRRKCTHCETRSRFQTTFPYCSSRCQSIHIESLYKKTQLPK